MANIKNEYNIKKPDIDPFAGTNLDAESTNTRGNAEEDGYNTYKNTIYNYNSSTSVWEPDSNVTNGDYPTAGVRNQMDVTSTIKIFQKEGMGSSINTNPLNVHNLRNEAAVELNPIEYTPNDGVETGELNHGNWSSHYDNSYIGDFDINMKRVTTSDNQMTYRDYTSKEDDEDAFTDMSSGVPDESTISSEGDITKGAIIEAGKHFNRGNDTTEGADINSSRVLDKSMFLNNYNTDILDLRGGAGIGTDGKYSSETETETVEG